MVNLRALAKVCAFLFAVKRLTSIVRYFNLLAFNNKKEIMKKFIKSLMFLLVFSSGTVFAQSSMLATLSHDGEITVFYGANALKEAHAAATHGDAITLSSGSFNAVDITKAITLRGAGMDVDTLKNTYPTIINGDFSIIIGDSVNEKLTIEGIYNNFTITISKGLSNATFMKSRLYGVSFSTSSGDTAVFKNNCFIHCKVVKSFVAPKYSNDTNFSFVNSYIKSLTNINYNSVFMNCIIFDEEITSITNSTFYNCIFIGDSKVTSDNRLSSTCQAYNCIVTDVRYVSAPDNPFFNIANKSNIVFPAIEGLFKTFRRDNYTDNETFELVDEVKTKYKGTDGTQIGLHGGALPFSSRTTNPQITKCNVASHSTADGKLSVEIEVTAGE